MPVEIENCQRKFPVDIRALSLLANEAQKSLGEKKKNYTITFVNNRRIRRINQEFRGKNSATDVLSFSYPNASAPEIPFPDGEILISTEKADRQAREQNISLEAEILNLIIHGLCHLAGYDHEADPAESLRMKRAERKIAELLRKTLHQSGVSFSGAKPQSGIQGKIPD
ncbi:MAG: rRNA maturation RNase YbeY [Nitrospirae bacterium]|jgi:probable rRNA maturation factor|nr:rRNA maturation RNase YbeY [Nitrospirota bacterium]